MTALPEAVILDFGGVLYDIDYDAPVRAFKTLGVEDFEDCTNRPVNPLNSMTWKADASRLRCFTVSWKAIVRPGRPAKPSWTRGTAS